MCSARPFPALWVTEKHSESKQAPVPNLNSQHKNTRRLSSKSRGALTLNALSDSMESRSPSKGIKSRLYCSRWMKDPSTPCSFSHCSQSRLRRGTNSMWKSLWGERPLSSLEESQAGAQQTVTQAAQATSTDRGLGALNSKEIGMLHVVIITTFRSRLCTSEYFVYPAVGIRCHRSETRAR